MLKEIPLKDIKFVLLDMDGTLLDLYFDDYFWGHLVPEKYAEKHDMTFGAARDYLYATYKKHERTLNWCDIDFWSKELRLDIPALNEQIRHLIEVHPHVIDFLKLMRRQRKLWGNIVHYQRYPHWHVLWVVMMIFLWVIT